MLNGFKFCHHCGEAVSVVTAAPEITAAEPAPEPEENLFLPSGPAEESGAAVMAEPETVQTQTAPEPDAGPYPEPQTGTEEEGGYVPAGRILILELLCAIPVLNFFLLVFMASSGRRSFLREYARGKLLALMTLTLLLLFAALTVVALMYFEVIEPIYLFRWGA
jgi:hypothetical protein